MLVILPYIAIFGPTIAYDMAFASVPYDIGVWLIVVIFLKSNIAVCALFILLATLFLPCSRATSLIASITRYAPHLTYAWSLSYQ